MKESQSKGNGLAWWGRTIYRWRRTVALLWLIAVLGFGFAALGTTDLLKDDGFTPKGSDSERGLALLREELGVSASYLNLVYVAPPGRELGSEAETRAILDSLSPLAESPEVAAIRPNPASRTDTANHIWSVLVYLNVPEDRAMEVYPELKEKIRAPEGLEVYVTGTTPVILDMQRASRSDIVKAEIIGLPIALIVLLLVFGTVPAAALPMAVGLASVSVTLGIVWFIARNVSLSNFLPNMVTMIGLAVGIDYALFMVSRFREELRRGGDAERAVVETSRTAGRSILFSGVAVLIGLVAMFLVDLNIFRSLALGGVLVVTVSVLAANTLLPALLGLLGRRIDSWPVLPKAWRERQSESRFWPGVASFVMRRPVPIVLVLASGLIALALPLGGMRLNVPDAEVLPPAYESRLGSDLLRQAYDRSELNPIQVALPLGVSYADPSAVSRVNRLTERLSALPGVRDVRSYAKLLASDGLPETGHGERPVNPALLDAVERSGLAKGETALITIVPEPEPDSEDAEALVRDVRLLVGEMEPDAFVTGGPAYRADILERIESKLWIVVGLVMAVTYAVLLLAFRSVLLPLKAVVMNALSLGASLGLVVIVFQEGFGADLLQVTSIGYVNAILPVVVFCVVFGISMDYEVFLLSRIAEEYEETGNNDGSTARGLARTGSLITSAAFILIAVVGSFIWTDIEVMKALGLGLAGAVLIDATLIRVLMVPALMKLLGRLNWWAPAWLRARG